MQYRHSVGTRVLAFMIDTFILRAVTQVLLSFGLGITVQTFFGEVETLTFWQETLLYIVYFVGFAIFNKGLTVGKMVLKLKVTTSGYEDLDQNRLIVREIIKVVLMPISFVSFIVMMFHSQRKSIHDMIMNTFVVKEETQIQDPYNLRQERPDVVNRRNEDVLSDDYYEGIDEEESNSYNEDDYYE